MPRKGLAMIVELEIFGQTYSAKNNRMPVKFKGRLCLRKSAPALNYERSFSLQCPNLGDDMLTGKLFTMMDIYYKTERPDLNDDLILDCMQGKIYKNDRQVRRRFLDHHIDKENPRTVILVGPIEYMSRPVVNKKAYDDRLISLYNKVNER